MQDEKSTSKDAGDPYTLRSLDPCSPIPSSPDFPCLSPASFASPEYSRPSSYCRAFPFTQPSPHSLAIRCQCSPSPLAAHGELAPSRNPTNCANPQRCSCRDVLDCGIEPKWKEAKEDKGCTAHTLRCCIPALALEYRRRIVWALLEYCAQKK